jgi:hypothetical protein
MVASFVAHEAVVTCSHQSSCVTKLGAVQAALCVGTTGALTAGSALGAAWVAERAGKLSVVLGARPLATGYAHHEPQHTGRHSDDLGVRPLCAKRWVMAKCMTHPVNADQRHRDHTGWHVR